MRVLHLAGSPVSDFWADLSLLYARDCWAATADPDRYEPLAAVVEPGGTWRFPAGLDAAALAAAPAVPAGDALARLAASGVDVAVPQMFCRPGMTAYRGVLDVLGIPYVGNRPEAMALGADKARARAVVAAAGVPVPAGEVLGRGERPTLDPPVVVKPVDADNSLGVTLVRDVAGFDGALSSAFEHADQALVEAYVELGREVRCGIIDIGGELRCLPLEEYAVAPDRPIRGYADKLAPSAGGLALQAKDPALAWIVDPADPVTDAVWAAARASHAALGCRHHSLFDFRIDPQGRPWFLEAGLYCSYATQSVITMMAAAADIELGELFALGVQAARVASTR